MERAVGWGRAQSKLPQGGTVHLKANGRGWFCFPHGMQLNVLPQHTVVVKGLHGLKKQLEKVMEEKSTKGY